MIYFSIRKSKLRYNKVEDYSEVRRNLITFQITCFGRLRFSFMILFQRSCLAEPFILLSYSKRFRKLFVSETPSHKIEPDFATSCILTDQELYAPVPITNMMFSFISCRLRFAFSANEFYYKGNYLYNIRYELISWHLMQKNSLLMPMIKLKMLNL